MNAIRFASISTAMGLVLSAPAALAQDNEDAAAEADDNVILVTARKRSETVQDVPISISVTSGAQLQEEGIRNIQALSQELPAVNVSQGGASDQVYIRGIGSGFNGGFEQAVGTYIDGAYLSRSRSTRLVFMDVDRIEVLKGPQTTFFGNSSIGGALSVATRNPGSDFAGNFSVLYTPRFEESDIQAGLDIPLGETLAVRVAGRKYDTDGHYTNSNTGGTLPQFDDWGIRGTVLWEPSADFDLTLKWTHGESDGNSTFAADVLDCPVPAPLPGGNAFRPCEANLAAFPEGDPRRFDGQQDYVSQTSANEPYSANFDQLNLSWNWNLGGVILSSVTAYTEFAQQESQDLDQSELNIFGANQNDAFEAIAQEIRLSSDNDSRFSWMVGGYYQDQDIDFAAGLAPYFIPPVFNNPVAAAPDTNLVSSTQSVSNEETLSFFAAVTYELSDTLRVNAGLRYTQVDKEFTNENFWASIPGTDLVFTDLSELTPVAAPFPGFATPNGPTSFSRKDDDILPSFGVEMDVFDDGLIYASFSQGFKAGGFALTDRGIVEGAVAGEAGFIGDRSFGPEQVDAFEVGFKGTWADGRVKTNITLFQSNYTGVQQSVLDASTFVFSVANAARSRSRGIELELGVEPFDGFSLSLDSTLLDAEFREFIGACSENQNQIFAADPTAAGACPQSAGPGTASQDLSGNETTFAPGYSGNLRAKYEGDLGGGWGITAQANVFFTDGYHIQSDFDPRIRVASFARIGARLAVEPPPLGNTDWEIAIVGKNLNDVARATFANDLSASPGAYRNTLGPPRSVAVQVSVDF